MQPKRKCQPINSRELIVCYFEDSSLLRLVPLASSLLQYGQFAIPLFWESNPPSVMREASG